MKLDKNEHSILATFPSSTKAQNAVKKIKKLGIDSISIDRVSKYGTNYDKNLNNPLGGQAETVTGLTLYSANTNAFSNNDERILQVSSPDVSGFANADYPSGGGEGFLVTVVLNDSKNLEKVIEILKENDGRV